MSIFFFFNDTATTEIYTLSLHDALPILVVELEKPVPYFEEQLAHTALFPQRKDIVEAQGDKYGSDPSKMVFNGPFVIERDRKSTRLNSSHANISYAVFCLKKKKMLYPIL